MASLVKQSRFNSSQLLMILLGIFLLSGCASPHLTHYEPLEEALKQRDYQTSAEILRTARAERRYQEKDRVLYWIEKGIALHYAGDYQRSNELLTLADDRMDELFTTRISEVGYAFITNPNETEYEADPHEDLYINIFKALNYLKLGQPESARVEARKLDTKLNYMYDRYQERADYYRDAAFDRDFVEQDSSDTALDFAVQAAEFHISALARYIGYMVYLHERSMDSVRIDWQHMRRAFSEQPALYNFDFPELPQRPQLSADAQPVHFIVKLGLGPIKQPQELYLPWRSGQHLKVGLPKMVRRGTTIDRVGIYQEGNQLVTLASFEDVNVIAENIFQLRFPAIMGTAFIRAIAKRVGASEARQLAEGQSPVLGLATWIAGEVYIEQSEQPDLRLVRTLPGQFQVGFTTLPPGDYQFEIRYYSQGRVVSTEKLERTVDSDSLNLVVGRAFQ